MKQKFILIVAFCLVIIISWIIFKKPDPQKLEAYAVTGAFIVSSIALFYAILEFEHHKNNDRTVLLCQYLHRYATDENIKNVLDYINKTALFDEDYNIIGFNDEKFSKYHNPPTLREKEMFMHFFEEVQMLIDSKIIKGEDAIELMGYYCGVFHKIKEYHQDITDYDDEKIWKKYLTFAKKSSEFFLCREEVG